MSLSADVIIVGAGIGGLTVAALLQHAGLQTLTFEQHTTAGGSASLFRKKGYTFDAGASMFYGFGSNEESGTLNLHTRIFNRLGISLKTIPDPVQIHYHLPNGFEVATHYDRERFLSELIARFPHEAKGIRAFYDELEKVFQIISTFPAGSLEDPLHLLRLAARYPRKVLRLAYYTTQSMGSVARRYLRNEELLRFIDIECESWALQDASATPFVNAGICLADRHHGGIRYPVGSSGAIAKALVEGIRKFGGEVRFATPVEEILLKEGRAIGVRLQNGEIHYAAAVVSNATIWDTFGNLVKDPRYRVDESKFEISPSWFQLHLGVDARIFPEGFHVHHIIVEDWQKYRELGGTIRLSAPSLLDKTCAPEGKHVLHAFVTSQANSWRKRYPKDEQYEAEKARQAEQLIRRIERILPGLSSAIELQYVATPLTHKRYLRRHLGSYGPLLKKGQIVLQRPQNSTPVKNLYAVGDSCFPGQGVIAVTYSGVACAHLICKKFGKKFEYL
ncbi:MAG: FAD-dependent oxidoreductase [Chloroherpetonaceae bacterium]|nr:FAD-dependent oxidoreductase [Chloroherpetonaceae bacterium]MDW8018479.1 FAD-dependent oxidoreductase [Chloroherpetonaceae bacterium]